MSLMPKFLLLSRIHRLAGCYPSSLRWRVMRDYFSLYRKKGLTTEDYYDFEFERQPDVFRDSFLGLREQRYYLELLNPIRYFSLARNKYLTHKVLEDSGIRTSTLYCFYLPGHVLSSGDLVAGSLKDVLCILKSKGVRECVMKRPEESHGDSVHVIREITYLENDCVLDFFNGSKALLSEVLGKDSLIFESLIRQTAQMERLNPSSVNTIRFMTTLYPDGHSEIIAAFIKIGRMGHCVDNAGRGGNVDAGVDVQTGRLEHAVRFDCMRKLIEIDCHPDNGSLLNGVVIENWDSICAEVLKFQQAFPWCRAAGWDVAVTPEGPVVVEVNDFWDRTGQAFIRRGWRHEIRQCFVAWINAGSSVNNGRYRNDFSESKCKRLFG